MKSVVFIIATITVVIVGVYYQRYFISKKDAERRAWLTLVINDDYVPGALALARSMKRADSIYPLVVLTVLDSLSEESQRVMLAEGCLLQPIQGLHVANDRAKLVFEHLTHAWTKLRVFEMVNLCQKCVFMDADMIVLQNVDELFELEGDPDFAAVQTCICNPARTPTYPEYWNPANCPYSHEEHSGEHTLTDDRGRVFNSGLFVFHPNLTVFDRMIVALDTWNLTDAKFADQNFLNRFYHDTWYRLPYIYNSLKTFSKTHPSLWDESKMKAVHFILGKPWNKKDKSYSEYEDVNRLWWQAYEWRADVA